jgi:hypothetical protein
MWCGLVLPFILTMINGGPDGWLPHVLFHPTYIALLAVGVVGAVRLRRSTPSGVVRGLAVAAIVTAVLAMAGHAGEFSVVVQQGGFAADESVFEEPLHQAAATLTVPMVMLAILCTVAASVVANLVARGRPVGPTVSRALRVTHRWTSVLFVLTLPLALTLAESAWATTPPIVFFVVMLITGVQMSIRHYLTRWRRRHASRLALRAATLAPQPATTSTLTVHQAEA